MTDKTEWKGAERPPNWGPKHPRDIFELPVLPREFSRLAYRAYPLRAHADDVVAAVRGDTVWTPISTEYGWYRRAQ